jgi:Phage XkdN-like tail assembly chaperone protein, TAC
MSELKAFLKQNKAERQTVKVTASENFKDEKGNVLQWEIRPLKTKEADFIRSECTAINQKGKKIEVDNAKFNRMIAAKCTVFPNLNDKELQDSYDVMSAEQLIVEMLDNDGEYQAYCQKILSISGYNKTDSELVDEAKN